VRPVIGQRLDVDPSAATPADVTTAVTGLLTTARVQEQEQALSHFADQLSAGDRQRGGRRAVAGTTGVLEALTEQRVQTLLLAGDWHAAGTQCQQCGLLYGSDVSSCPVDQTATAAVEDLREPMIAAAIRQDADVVVFDELGPALGTPGRGVGALLRF
jgi:peptide subunit release factor 1 (eRF1)